MTNSTLNNLVDGKILKTLEQADNECQMLYMRTIKRCEANQFKVLQAFHDMRVSDFHLNGSTGYGYGDSGRDALEGVFARIFHTEKALVRAQIVSGTHAIALGLLGNLQAGEELILATGTPYDTLHKVIGFHREYGSLAYMGVTHRVIPLKEDGDIDSASLLSSITDKTRLVFFQRSKGYEWRPSFSVQRLGEVIRALKEKHTHIICMVDNCYGEFVETEEPTDVGADLVAGSLIKNPGGGLALTGGYLAGTEEVIDRAAVRLAAPGIGLGMGASLNFNRPAFQGLFLAPLIVGETVKGGILAAKFFELLGYPVLPAFNQPRTDIIQAIRLGSREAMIAFCRGIQKACPIDAHALPEPALLPGYEDEVIMAGGTFIQGSSIELSADGPIRPPYQIYLQGGLSLSHIKIGLALAAQELAVICPLPDISSVMNA